MNVVATITKVRITSRSLLRCLSLFLSIQAQDRHSEYDGCDHSDVAGGIMSIERSCWESLDSLSSFMLHRGDCTEHSAYERDITHGDGKLHLCEPPSKEERLRVDIKTQQRLRESVPHCELVNNPLEHGTTYTALVQCLLKEKTKLAVMMFWCTSESRVDVIKRDVSKSGWFSRVRMSGGVGVAIHHNAGFAALSYWMVRALRQS
ncbi:hypothetical protein CBL_05447 [Carabus blaptoides fortunei]